MSHWTQQQLIQNVLDENASIVPNINLMKFF